MNALDIEWFDQQHTRFDSQPTLGLQKRGTATLNNAAIEALGDPKALLIGFDRDRHIIAVKGTEPGVKGAYPVRRVGASSTVIVSLKAFAAKYGIPLGDVRRYIGTENNGILLFHVEDMTKEEPMA